MDTVLIDLSKAFDCILHDLIAAKLHAYGLSEDAVNFVHSYLKCRKQVVKKIALRVFFQKLLSGIPQGFILDPILFNILINKRNKMVFIRSSPSFFRAYLYVVAK